MNPNKILIILISISFIVLGFALKNRSDYLEEKKISLDIENNISSTSTKREDEKSNQEEINIYQVRKGDTLWEIAEAKYGSGFKYPEIIKKNPGKTFKFADGREGLIYEGTVLNL